MVSAPALWMLIRLAPPAPRKPSENTFRARYVLFFEFQLVQVGEKIRAGK